MSKYVAVAMITIGIVLATQASTDVMVRHTPGYGWDQLLLVQGKIVEVVEKDDLVVEVEDDNEIADGELAMMEMVWMTIGQGNTVN